jgi:tetratricopeptide (TPR) repeat protein
MQETAATPAPAGGALSSGPPAVPRSRLRRWAGALLSPFRRPWRLLAVTAIVAVILLGVGLAGAHLWALHHYRAARAELERYHTATARLHLEACLTVWPRSPDALLLAARAARRSDAFDAAEDFLGRAEKAGAGEEGLLLERLLLRAQRGEVDEVRPFCRALLDGDGPDAPLALEALARGLARTYRLKEAEGALDRWRKLQPDNAQEAFLRGTLYDQTDRRTDALAAFRRALQIDPEQDEARLRLIGVLFLNGLYAEAVSHLEYLRVRLPGNPLVPVQLARCRAWLDRRPEAVELLDGALARWPHFAPALAERGKLALEAGQLERAEAWLGEAVRRAPDNYQAWSQYQRCLQGLGKADEAARVEERLRLMQKDIARLHEIMSGEMQRAPHSAALHTEAGRIWLRAGAAAEGLRWLHSALKEAPDYAPAHQALADFYVSTGERALATRHLELARTGRR